MAELLYDVRDGVATITLNRPDSLNAMTVGLLEQLLAAVTLAGDDPAIGCVVLTGAGRGFCAGGDVKDQAQRAAPAAGTRPSSLETRVAQLRRFADISRLLHEMPKPTVAMLNGVAAGAGMKVERVLRIEEQRAGGGGPRPMMMTTIAAQEARTPVAPGEMEIRATVLLTAAVR